MTSPEKLKDTLSSIFRRKGANGGYTRIFDDLEPPQQRSLLENMRLSPDELPVIGSANQGAENHVTDFMTRHSKLLGLEP